MKNSIIGKIIKVDRYRNLLTLLNMSDERFYKKGYKIEFLDDLGQRHIQNILSHMVIDDFEDFTGHEIQLCTIRDRVNSKRVLIDSVNIKETDTIINCIINPNSKSKKDKWFYVRNLHIHHLNYPDDDNVANVSNIDLITLCATCHQKEHPHRNLVGVCD